VTKLKNGSLEVCHVVRSVFSCLCLWKFGSDVKKRVWLM